MPQVPIPPDRVQDPFERNVPGLGCGRDGARTPMQWDASANAGFSTGPPWLPIAEGFGRDNVAAQRTDPTSIHSLYRRLLALRRRSPALVLGAYRPIVARGDLLLFYREHEGTRMLVALNLGGEPLVVDAAGKIQGAVALSSTSLRDGEAVDGETLTLGANEGLVIALAPSPYPAPTPNPLPHGDRKSVV